MRVSDECWICRTEEREEVVCVGFVGLRYDGKGRVFDMSV